MPCKAQERSRRHCSAWLLLVAMVLCAVPASAVPADALADRLPGQANLRSYAPYFVAGRVFGAAAIAFDRSVAPNRVYVADAELNRVLGWSSERGFLRGQPADLVLGQPDLSTGEFVDLYGIHS